MLRKLAAVSLLSLFSAPLFAAECAIEIEGNDMMQYNLAEITVPTSCKQFAVTLKHPGKLGKEVMGHNWVLTTTADMQGVATEGLAAGIDHDYLKAGDTRIIAHTKLIGAGESDTTTIDVSKLTAGGDYTYFCSFPGHSALMKGKLIVQ